MLVLGWPRTGPIGKRVLLLTAFTLKDVSPAPKLWEDSSLPIPGHLPAVAPSQDPLLVHCVGSWCHRVRGWGAGEIWGQAGSQG